MTDDLTCLRAAVAGGRSRAARRGRALIDAALARNLAQFRRLERAVPGAAAHVLQKIVRRWPRLVRAMRDDVKRWIAARGMAGTREEASDVGE
jgi:hypothetical protein